MPGLITPQYTNPILSGFYPDPSICSRDGEYFLVTSTFAWFPGIPLFHSYDLVNWKLLGHALNRTSQLDLSGVGVSKGIFAPSIRYHKDVFYITCTFVDGGGNFVITATNPCGPWSDPVWLHNVKGIDPSLFFEKNGSAWLVYNSSPPNDKALYNGHRTIRMRSFDPLLLQANDDEQFLVNGGTDIVKKPIWIEGPHLLQRNNYYYLIAAEGGTGYDHSVVVFRSKCVDGPYIPYENNPVLAQRHLRSDRIFPVTSTGHADLVQTTDDQWQAVFLGCRPYEADHYNTGRETFLVPVTWKEDWPVLNVGRDTVGYHYDLPLPEKKENGYERKSGNFYYRDEFDEPHLTAEWMFLRTPYEQWYDLNDKHGFIAIKLRPETCSGHSNPSLIGRRQQHMKCSASTSIAFVPIHENEKAGLLVFQNQDHFYFLCISTRDGDNVVELYQSVLMPRDQCTMNLINRQAIPISEDKCAYLKIVEEKNSYHFYYASTENEWKALQKNMDARFLSTCTAGGFVGCTFCLYATSLGKPSDNVVHFGWYEYSGQDEFWEGKE